MPANSSRVALTDAPVTRDVTIECAAPDYAIYLELCNESSQHQVFKLKTNAPGRWFVKPNGGIIAPGEKAYLSIRVAQRDNMRGVEDDRHLVLSAPISAAEAEEIRGHRESQPRSSPHKPRADDPDASLLRVTPSFPVAAPSSADAAPMALSPTVTSSATLPAAKPGHSPGDRLMSEMQSPVQSPMLTPTSHVASSGQAKAAIVESPRRVSVTEQVAELDRKYSTLFQSASRHGMRRAGRGSTGAEEDEEDGTSSAGSSAGSGRPRSLFERLLSLLSAMADEAIPWLS